jgi:hypothetical protein
VAIGLGGIRITFFLRVLRVLRGGMPPILIPTADPLFFIVKIVGSGQWAMDTNIRWCL